MATDTPRGRPSIPGIDVTLSVSDAALTEISLGAELLSQLDGHKPSKASWLRLLLDTVSRNEPENLMNAQELESRWPSSMKITATKPITVRLQEHHRIWLRRWECYVQSLDWSRPLYGKETVSILIESEGQLLNAMNRKRLEIANKC